MSIAAMKRRRKQFAKGNRHLAKIGRPGLPKKISVAKSSKRLAMRIATLKRIQSNKGAKK